MSTDWLCFDPICTEQQLSHCVGLQAALCFDMASQTGTQKHRQVHHLSREAGDPHGWVESITGLTADQPATDLLNNGSSSKQNTSTVGQQQVELIIMTLLSKNCQTAELQSEVAKLYCRQMGPMQMRQDHQWFRQCLDCRLMRRMTCGWSMLWRF